MHYYKFEIDDQIIICRAHRQKEINDLFVKEPVHLGCVDKFKICDLRRNSGWPVLGSTQTLQNIVSLTKPSLLK